MYSSVTFFKQKCVFNSCSSVKIFIYSRSFPEDHFNLRCLFLFSLVGWVFCFIFVYLSVFVDRNWWSHCAQIFVSLFPLFCIFPHHFSQPPIFHRTLFPLVVIGFAGWSAFNASYFLYRYYNLHVRVHICSLVSTYTNSSWLEYFFTGIFSCELLYSIPFRNVSCYGFSVQLIFLFYFIFSC